jgi:solute carrier family 15 (peptide/histidine transporter), member 3/4
LDILTLTAWVTVYERALVRPLSRLTGHALFAVAMGVAAHTESTRRAAAIAEGLRDFGPHSGRTVHMSAMRLVPQYCLLGLAEALNVVGQIEFYYAEFPKTMSSIGVSLQALAMGFGAVLGSAIVGVISAATKRDGRDGWLGNNLNKWHYDYYYLVLTVLCATNLVYLLVCGWFYGEEGQNRVAALDAERAAAGAQSDD